MNDDDVLVCSECNKPVEGNTAFCPHCGASFMDDRACPLHPDRKATGMCAICKRVGCDVCGERTYDVWLCNDHRAIESYEGMARVYGTTDVVQAEYVSSMLEQAGLHPFVYSPQRVPRTDLNPIFTISQVPGHMFAEQKVMVPFQEFLEAEKVLKELEIIKGGQ